MAGYVDNQVAAYRKTVGEAVAGKGVRDAIRQLQEKSRVRDSLKDLPARGAITGKRQIGRRVGSEIRDFTELSRNFHGTLRTLYDSSGVFQIRYYNVRQIVMDQATFNYLDYDPTST